MLPVPHNSSSAPTSGTPFHATQLSATIGTHTNCQTATNITVPFSLPLLFGLEVEKLQRHS
ncbi:hypothetical protein RYX36_007376 [Vicia faba]